MRTVIPLISLMILIGCGQHSSSGEFESIRQIVCQGRFADAIPKLKAYEGQHQSRAGLFLGKAHLGLGDLEAARQTFTATVRDFPDSLEAHKCRYKLALLSLLKGDSAAARVQFAELSNEANGPLVAEAKAMAEYLE
jgi:TolA-binding protein